MIGPGRRARSADNADVVRKPRSRHAPQPSRAAAASSILQERRRLAPRVCCIRESAAATALLGTELAAPPERIRRAGCLLSLFCLPAPEVSAECVPVPKTPSSEPAEQAAPKARAFPKTPREDNAQALQAELPNDRAMSSTSCPQVAGGHCDRKILGLAHGGNAHTAMSACRQASPRSALDRQILGLDIAGSGVVEQKAALARSAQAAHKARNYHSADQSAGFSRDGNEDIPFDAEDADEESCTLDQWDASFQLCRAMEGYNANRIEEACRYAEAAGLTTSKIEDARREARSLRWQASVQLCRAIQNAGDRAGSVSKLAEEMQLTPARLRDANLQLCRAMTGRSSAYIEDASNRVEAAGVARSDIDDALQEARRLRWEACAQLRRSLEGYNADCIDEACRRALLAGVAHSEIEEARQEARSLRLEANASRGRKSYSVAAIKGVRKRATTDPVSMCGVDKARTDANLQLRRAMEGYNATRIEDACRRADAAGVPRFEIDDALQEARRLRWEACAQLRRALEGYNADRIEEACRRAELAGVTHSQIEEARQEARALRSAAEVRPTRGMDSSADVPFKDARRRAATDPSGLSLCSNSIVTERQIENLFGEEKQAQDDEEIEVEVSGYTAMILAAHRKMTAKRKGTM